MNTLFFPAGNPGPGGLQAGVPSGAPELRRILNSSQPVAACIAAFAAGQFPLEIEGSEGSFSSLLLASLYQAAPGRCFVVVPQENDAADLALDLEAAGIPALHFPWWGAAPYNELPPLSAVFGERAKVLGDLVTGKAGIVIIPERAFLTPLPPPGYVKSLLVSLTPGGTIDTAALAKTLVSYGYTRVPQVQVHGEFALRGEVLDILMGGDDEARRVLFDFDRVETIRRFDPVNQGSVGERGRDTLPELLIRPLREVVWTDDRIGALANNLSTYREFAGGGRALVEALGSRRRVDGEELLYPLAFDAAGSLLDYLGAGGPWCCLTGTGWKTPRTTSAKSTRVCMPRRSAPGTKKPWRGGTPCGCRKNTPCRNGCCLT